MPCKKSEWIFYFCENENRDSVSLGSRYFSMCYSFSCLFLIFLLVFENHFFSLFSFVLHPSVNTIRRHSSPFEKLLWNACFGYSANVNSVQFNSIQCSWVCMCVYCCFASAFFLSFSFFLFWSRWRKCVCVSFWPTHWNARMQSPYMYGEMV